jgi:transposase
MAAMTAIVMAGRCVRYGQRARGQITAGWFCLEALMPLLRAVPVTLTAAERKTLKKRARGAKTAHRDRQRAQIVLAAARGRSNARIAADLRVTADTARKWRGRFAARGLEGLADRPRAGRPRRISALERAAICALACQLPAATGVPLARWTGPELATEITRAGLASQISASSILRILAEHPIKPWQYQSWIFPRDPHFAAKATVILDLYQGFYGGKPLGPGDRVVSSVILCSNKFLLSFRRSGLSRTRP